MVKIQQYTKNNMKISHELPLSLMHHGYEWNDYDYMLPHLIDKYMQYEIYFLKARKDGRFIIMDNGLFSVQKSTLETNPQQCLGTKLQEPKVLFIFP